MFEEIQGIVNDKKVTDVIHYDSFKSLINDYLEFGPYFVVMMDILKKEFNYVLGNKDNNKTNIKLFHIFSSLNTLQFFKEIPSYLNGRVTNLNIKIIITALIIFAKNLMHTSDKYQCMSDIKHAVLVFQLKERELMKEGIPCEANIINSLLRKINKTIYSKVLNVWIEKCRPFLEVKDTLQTHEFLYLACNSENRRLFQSKISDVVMEGNMDKKTRLFKFDNSLYKNLRNPDERIQAQMPQYYNMEEMNFKGMDIENKEDANIIKKKNKVIEILRNDDCGKEEFKKLLKDPELLVEIKEKLKNFRQILNHSKLSGKSLKYKIMDEINKKEAIFLTQDFGTKNVRNQSANNLGKIMDNNIYKKKQNQVQKPLDEKIIQQFMTEIQEQREQYREQIEAEYQENQNKVEQVKVIHPFIQHDTSESELDLQKPRRNKYTKIVKISRPQTSKNQEMLDEILLETTQQGIHRDEQLKKNNAHIFYGTSKLSTLRNFQITGVKQIVKSIHN